MDGWESQFSLAELERMAMTPFLGINSAVRPDNLDAPKVKKIVDTCAHGVRMRHRYRETDRPSA